MHVQGECLPRMTGYFSAMFTKCVEKGLFLIHRIADVCVCACVRASGGPMFAENFFPKQKLSITLQR